jgi:predicted ATPase
MVKIRIEIELDNIDDANIDSLRSNHDKLKNIALLYSRTNLIISLITEKKITIDINLNYAENNFTTTFTSNGSDLVFNYLQDYNYKELITLYNKENPNDLIPLLHDPFILIGGYRNYHTFNPTISLQTPPANQFQEIRNKEFTRSINASEQSEPAIFNIVRLFVAETHFDLFSTQLDESQCELKANNLPFLISINKRLSLINLECKIRLIEKRTWEYSFEFFDTNKQRIISDINSLSAGQKAIIHLIFEAYGRSDIKGGVVIIDEPEIHLHYQFQNEYLRIIKEINREQKCQYILVTHSESLINSETIGKIKRFASDENNFTVIKSPNLPDDQKTLIKILDNSRSTYAFFSKKIVLVEGDTDRYFYKAALQLLHPKLISDAKRITCDQGVDNTISGECTTE